MFKNFSHQIFNKKASIKVFVCGTRRHTNHTVFGEIQKPTSKQLGVVVCTRNPSTQETEVRLCTAQRWPHRERLLCHTKRRKNHSTPRVSHGADPESPQLSATNPSTSPPLLCESENPQDCFYEGCHGHPTWLKGRVGKSKQRSGHPHNRDKTSDLSQGQLQMPRALRKPTNAREQPRQCASSRGPDPYCFSPKEHNLPEAQHKESYKGLKEDE